MARQVKRKRRKPTTTAKPDSDISGLLRTLRPRKPTGGRVVLHGIAASAQTRSRKIARQKHPGQAQAAADDLHAYLTVLGGTEAAGRLTREVVSEIAFGTYKWPSEMADELGEVNIELF